MYRLVLFLFLLPFHLWAQQSWKPSGERATAAPADPLPQQSQLAGKTYQLSQEGQLERLDADKESLIAGEEQIPEKFDAVLGLEPDHLLLLSEGKLFLWQRITSRWTQVAGLEEPIQGMAVAGEDELVLQDSSAWHFGRIEAQRNHIGWIDWLVLGAYAALVIGIGVLASRQERDGEDFFLGGRSIPWFLAGLSMYATGISAISYMLIPARTYSSNWQAIGEPIASMFAWILVAILAVPLLRKLPISTVYEYLERRFGLSIRLLGSATFVLTQILGRMALILLIPAQALAVVTGWTVPFCILSVGSLAILYTMLGGIKAVVWTDSLQVGIIFLGVMTCLIAVHLQVPGGLGGAVDLAREAGRMQMVDLSFRFDQETLWVFFFVGTTGIFGKFGDQHTMQRAFATADVREAQKSVCTFALISLPGAALFFLLGSALFGWFASHPEVMTPGLSTDSSVLPQFTLQALPPGGVGIVMAGLFAAAMSTLDSAMNGVALVVTRDMARVRPSEKQHDVQVKQGRWISLAAGILGVGIALLLNGMQNRDASLWKLIVEVSGLIGGGYAAVFALGFMTKRASSLGAWIGILIASALSWGIKAYELHQGVRLIDPWFIAPLALCVSFICGYLGSLIFPHRGSLAGLTWFTLSEQNAGSQR